MSELPEPPNEPLVEVRIKGSGEWHPVVHYTIHKSGYLSWEDMVDSHGKRAGVGLARPDDWRFDATPSITFMCGEDGCTAIVDERWCPKVQ